jgi:hypothetical protein
MTSQELDFDSPVVNIGSHPENEVVLTGTGVLPFHATMHLQEGQFHFVALGGISAIKIDGTQLTATPVKFSPMQRVEIGGYTLAFQPKGGSNGLHVSVSRSAAAGSVMMGQSALIPATSPTGDSPILVNVLPKQLEVAVGQTAVYEIEIINAGPIVAGFSVSTQGLPDAWIKVEPTVVNLYEGQRAMVHISVTPPRDPGSKAGSHSLQAIVSSPNYASQPVQTQLTLNILPYYEFTIGNLSPKQQRIYWRKRSGIVKLPISNTGNSEADFNITAFDDENGCSFDFKVSKDVERSRQTMINIPAGQSISMPIEVTPLKRPIAALRSKDYHYTATTQLTQQSSLSQTVSGTVTSVPLIGWWTIVLALALILIGLFILVQPRIYSFEVAAGKDIIEQGDTTKLDWSVSPFATTLSLSNYDQAINRGQVSQTIAPTQSTTYELAASNWLSGLFGLDQKKTQTILVVPPKPVINVFEVDRTSVPEGTSVNVRWSVSKADKTLLTIDKVVYELKPDQFSGEQQVALTKDSLVTLEAVNASGSELRSYFIKIVQPKITVNSFVVWVRPTKTTSVGVPSVAALNSMGKGGGLLALSPAALASRNGLGVHSPMAVPPDPNFPERYVGLVPDKAADLGYRVEFYQPDRELSKGEQIMIQWDIEGADNDKLQIAPFTEALPDRGAQPFFPQESMNFVMTAKSGKLERLFMLPVKVFDGTPPTAPKIEFFKATPLSMTGSGKVQFAWSVSGEWTRVQLFTEKKVIADYLTPQGFKTINVSASGTYILTAWNGNLSSSAPLDITVNPDLIDPGLVVISISPTTGRAQVGSKLTVTIGFTSIPSGTASPTGSVTVTDGSATCPIMLPAVTCTLQFTTSGTKTITASFPGDKIYKQSTSPGFPLQVEVASTQVDLLPVFYFNGGTSPISVETSTFDMDKGLRTVVEVRPKNTVLADNNGNISVSLCQQTSTGAVINSTCKFVGAAQVKVAATTANGQTAGYGYADLVIQNFNASGVRGLLFEYTHSSNAIDPTSIFQPNIHINRAKLVLSLSTCLSPITFTSCTYGLVAGTTPELIFDLNIPGPSTLIPLSSLLPAPQTSAFTISSNPAATWTCSVKVISGTHKLSCMVTGAGLVAGTTYTINYDYNNADPLLSGARNDYYMGSDPTIPFGPASFQLKVLDNTKVLIGNLSGVKVGERIRLTGPDLTTAGIVEIRNSTGRFFPSTGLTLEEKSGADIFGVENEGVNCTRDNGNGSKVVVTAANADCFIYFKHIGSSYTLVATFAGDATNNGGTSGDTPVSVQKQDQISATIKYLDPVAGDYTTTFPPNFITNTGSSIRVELDGPSSSFSPGNTSFPPTALVDRKVLVTLTNAFSIANCQITTNSLVADLTGGVYEVTITQKAKGDPTIPASLTYVTAADFDISCSLGNTIGLSFTVTFSDKTNPTKDSDDFGFAISPIGKTNIPVSLPSLGSMTVSVLRQDTANTEMADSVAKTIGKLHFGQIYSVGITGSTDIAVKYNYEVKAVYTWQCPYGILCILAYWTRNIDPVVASQNARNQVLSNYTANAKWNVDPANFLNKDNNLGTVGSTCVSSNMPTDMPLTPTDHTSTPPPEYYHLSLSTSYHWNFPILERTETYLYSYYGTMTLRLSSAQRCTLVFDGTTNDNSFTGGTIAINARSGDGLFEVNSAYTVQQIDKQTTSMTFSPSGKTIGYTNSDLPITATLSSTDIIGGTALALVNTGLPFSGQFSPTPTSFAGACSNMSRTNTLTATGVIQKFLSTSPVASTSTCGIGLQYVGNKHFKGVGPLDLPEMEFKDNTTSITLLPAPASPSTYGASVTFTATITPNTLAGTVVFKDGGVALGPPVTVSGGTASYSTTSLNVVNSPHSITATFTPTDTNYLPSTTSPAQSVSHAVTTATTTTTITSPATPASATYGATVAITATVNPSSAAGSVQFMDGSTPLGTPVTVSGGTATLPAPSLNVANSPHTITAVFTPSNTNYSTSTSPALIYTISAVTTTTSNVTLVAPAPPLHPTANLTLAATVSSAPSSVAPIGSVHFYDGTTLLGTATVSSGSNPNITYTFNITLPVGNYSVTATYVPANSNLATSSSGTALPINVVP